MVVQIGILDIAMGNLRSVANAFAECGLDTRILESGRELDALTHLVIPGVGHFSHAMKEINARQLLHPIREYAASGRPLLGLCVGMQILAKLGHEGEAKPGLGLVPGEVVRLPEREGLPVPHVGWNDLRLIFHHPIFEGVKPNRDVYYVHSFVFQCFEDRHRLAVTDYGGPITAVVGQDNVIGFQFHPEKSQLSGLKLLENFASWNGRC